MDSIFGTDRGQFLRLFDRMRTGNPLSVSLPRRGRDCDTGRPLAFRVRRRTMPRMNSKQYVPAFWTPMMIEANGQYVSCNFGSDDDVPMTRLSASFPRRPGMRSKTR